MLPQFAKNTIYKLNHQHLAVGLTIFFLGLFKKVVLADGVAVYATPVFEAAEQGVMLTFFEAWAGALAYTFQLYFDFSGYSDMAIGIARMFGVRLPLNFNSPYKSVNIIEFWRRWHITLSRFLRDYLYIPLGGNRKGKFRRYINLMITMLLGGLWHGASWNFVIWGAYHGGILSIYRLFHANQQNTDPWGDRYSSLIVLLKLLSMFTLTLIGWVIFRCQSVHQIIYMLQHSLFISFDIDARNAFDFLFYSLPLVIVQVWQHLSGDLLIITKQTSFIKGLIYGLLIFGLVVFGARESMEFIYFQF
jgi:D-alanyl-lipoteichoic acid acyltransferase DltB (MBOAT superfamily)